MSCRENLFEKETTTTTKEKNFFITGRGQKKKKENTKDDDAFLKGQKTTHARGKTNISLLKKNNTRDEDET